MLRSASARPPSTQEGIIATLRNVTALIRTFRRACILCSAVAVVIGLIMLSRWSRSSDSTKQLPQTHDTGQNNRASKLALVDTAHPSAAVTAPPLRPSAAPTTLPSTLRDLMDHDQAFFCSVSPYLTLKETVEKRVTLPASATEPPRKTALTDPTSPAPSSPSDLSWLMHLLPFGRDIVSTELYSQRGWDTHKTREMLLMMQGALPQLNYSVATARRFLRSDPMGSEESQRLFVDVGANIGWFTLSLAAAGCRVAAFEPLQHNALALRTSLCRNAGLMPPERVRMYALGLGESAQHCAVYSASRNVGDGHVVCRSEEEVAAAKSLIAQRAQERAARRMQQATGAAEATSNSPAASRRRLLAAGQEGMRKSEAPRSSPTQSPSPSARSGISLEKLKTHYHPPKKQNGKGSQAQQPRDREHAPRHNHPAVSQVAKVSASVNEEPTDESPPPPALSNSAALATDDPDFVAVVPAPASSPAAAAIKRAPTTTALIRHHSLALTREWNTTGLLPPGYFVRNELRLVRLDSLITEPVHLLKLDVEGFELRVLRGATALFDDDRLGVRFIVAEFSPAMLRKLGSEPREMLDFFAKRGYEIRMIQRGFNIDRVVREEEFDSFCQTEEGLEKSAKPTKGPRRLLAPPSPRQCELFILKPQEMDSA